MKSAKHDHGMHWSNRRQHMLGVFFLIGALTFALIAAAWRVNQLAGAPLQAAFAEEDYVDVLIAAGDTLWRLAVEHGPMGADPRHTVAAIIEANELENADLTPGTVLRIPVQERGSQWILAIKR